MIYRIFLLVELFYLFGVYSTSVYIPNSAGATQPLNFIPEIALNNCFVSHCIRWK